MHLLQICHFDIKLDNVAWSNETKKMILLDFGLSKIIKEKIGQKTYTKFVGSFQQASSEMQKTYFLKKKLLVNLYYNDQWGL